MSGAARDIEVTREVGRAHGLTDYEYDKMISILGRTPSFTELVPAGMAWWYRQYAPHDTTLQRLEEEARLAQRGLWSAPHVVPPWEWRKQRR